MGIPVHVLSVAVRARLRIAKTGAKVLAVLMGVALGLQLTSAAAQSPTDDPCSGSKALLAILDRPTVGDSACVVPNGNVVLELGAKRGKAQDSGRGFSLPEAEFRFGMPADNELVFLPPNYLHQSGPGTTIDGSGPAVVGIKHELGYTDKWLGAVESLVTLPSGSPAFGSAGAGVAFNGIVSYSPTSNTGLSMMLGVSIRPCRSRTAADAIPASTRTLSPPGRRLTAGSSMRKSMGRPGRAQTRARDGIPMAACSIF